MVRLLICMFRSAAFQLPFIITLSRAERAANSTPATGHIIHVKSHLPLQKLHPRYTAVTVHQYIPPKGSIFLLRFLSLMILSANIIMSIPFLFDKSCALPYYSICLHCNNTLSSGCMPPCSLYNLSPAGFRYVFFCRNSLSAKSSMVSQQSCITLSLSSVPSYMR